MLQRTKQDRRHPGGATIDRVRTYEAVSNIAFLGRRRRGFTGIVALSGARPGDRALDVGCGGGYLARLLAAAVGPTGHVTGIDPSEAAVDYARRRAPANCSFAVGVAQDLDLPDRSFDVVASTLAVHHIPEAARQTAFDELYRVTRPGGTLLVADFRPSSAHHAPHVGSHAMRHGSSDLLDELAAAAGFRVAARGELPMLRYIKAVRPNDAA